MQVLPVKGLAMNRSSTGTVLASAGSVAASADVSRGAADTPARGCEPHGAAGTRSDDDTGEQAEPSHGLSVPRSRRWTSSSSSTDHWSSA